jgi:hypothetical protein
MVQDTILQLDIAQESRALEADELDLRRALKSRVLGLAVVERIRIKQRARVNWMRAGDANTKFFHVKASARRRKNFIATIAGDGVIATEHQHKAKLIKDFFDGLLGSAPSPSATIDWQALHMPQLDLSELDAPFSADEVRQAIADLPADRAPGPDGFSGVSSRRLPVSSCRIYCLPLGSCTP